MKLELSYVQIGRLIYAVEDRAVMWERNGRDTTDTEKGRTESNKYALEYRMLADDLRRKTRE